MQKSCEQIEKLLVDYADGELPPRQSSKVTGHLAKCQRCRSTLKAVQRSLDLADVIWKDGLTEIKTVGIAKAPPVRRFKWRRYAAVAASILIAAGISIRWRMMTSPKEAVPNIAEIERTIQEAGRAARLLAAAELLAEYPDAQSIAEQQYRYIVETYPQTPAAAEVKSRIQ
ncbi:MAG: anti-sigma factor family protein [Planctomycetota bacterium]|jgi:anti-sigma factor RsiW